MIVFGEAADAYDEGRPAYPDRLIDDVLSYAGPGCRRAVEVGAGTGKASAQFAARGLDLVCLEPDRQMAAVLVTRCRPWPAMEVRVTRFEDWSPGRRFDLLISAQAWHWVNPRVRWDQALAALIPGGTLALFWHYYSVREPEIRDALRHINARGGLPELDQHTLEKLPSVPEEDPEAEPWIELRADDRFTDKETRRYHGGHTFTAHRYLQLMTSFSTFRLAPENQRQELLDKARNVIADSGGHIELSIATDLLLARTRSSSRPGR
jgi:SAM-dependent methyltransferase